jgi:CBS domain-containing membrane protein
MATLETAAELLSGSVEDVMTTDVHTALANATVAEVAKTMADNNLRRIVVLNHRKRVAGVVSQRDIIKGYLAGDDKRSSGGENSIGSAAIETLISRDKPVTVPPEVALVKAAVVLATNKIGCLPVVGVRQDLKGVLTTTDLLRHLTGDTGDSLESSFQLFTPASDARARMPAYIRKLSGDLVVPLTCLEDQRAETDWAVLGYDPPSGRILIKIIPGGNKNDDALAVKRDDEYLIIQASGFVNHFDLAGRTTAFDVSSHEGSRYLVLTPRRSSLGASQPGEGQ